MKQRHAPVQVIFLVLTLLLLSEIRAQHITQLMGMCKYGGNDGIGTIIRYTPGNSKVDVDFSFPSPVGGSQPNGLTHIGNGNFYGMTVNGGKYGLGVIYQWDAINNIYTRKFEFDGKLTGKWPLGSLTFFNNKLYGMTQYGGVNDKGVIFEFDPVTGVFVKKKDFAGGDGSEPYGGGLTVYNGKLYGMTGYGGSYGYGVIFEWDPATNTYIKKIDFDGTNKGSYPYGADATLSLLSNKFYGMTTSGGSHNSGVIFEWDPAGNIFTKKHDFDYLKDGESPSGSLTVYNGKLYGLTLSGGAFNRGILFEFDPVNDSLTKKIDFDSSTKGSRPYSTLTLYNNKLYSVTSEGGKTDKGILFEWDPATNIFLKRYEFNGLNGEAPGAVLIVYNNRMYSVTGNGGGNYQGVIFEWDPALNVFSKKIDFMDAPQGKHPEGSLFLLNGKLYGMTLLGGTSKSFYSTASDFGVLFAWDPNSHTYTKLSDFDCVNTGAFPCGSLTSNNNKLYGVTPWGNYDITKNATLYGTIFETDPVTGNFILKNRFDGSNSLRGTYPKGALTYLNGKFYGITSNEDGSWPSIVYEWNPANNVLTNRYNFNPAADGNHTYGSLSIYNGKLYGLAKTSGAYGSGTIFEWDPAGNTFTKKIDFDGSSKGAAPYGSLTLYNGKFYGMTQSGGSNNKGVIFEWDPATNNFTKQVDFDGTLKGAGPYGSLTISNGKFYGMTEKGGAYDKGVIFEWDPVSNIFLRKVSLNDTIGYGPVYTHFVSILSNQSPSLGNLPGIRMKCPGVASDTLYFFASDKDNDTFNFTATSSNNLLVGASGIKITHMSDSLYRVIYSIQPAVSGSTVVTLTCKDNYAGSASANIIISVNAPIPVITKLNDSTLQSTNANSYKWYKNGNPVNGAISQNYKPSTGGNYEVETVDSNGCVRRSAIFSFSMTGLGDLTEKGIFKCYPNPNRGIVNISLGMENRSAVHISLSNAIGEIVYTEEVFPKENSMQKEITLKEIKRGLYFLTISTENRIYHSPIIIRD